MPNIQAVTGRFQSAVQNNAHIKAVLQGANGTWVGVHDLKTELRKLCIDGAEGLVNSLSNRLKTLQCKILTIPKTEKGILPAMPKDPFTTRSFYLVKNTYPDCNISNYIHLHDSANSTLSVGDLEAILSQLTNPKWTSGDDIMYYKKALDEREKILNSYVAAGYKWSPETRINVRRAWEKKMCGTSLKLQHKPSTESVVQTQVKQVNVQDNLTSNVTSVPVKTVQKTLPVAQTSPVVKKTALLLAIPKEVSDVCQKVPQKSAFRKYPSKLRELRYSFKDEKLEYIGNDDKIALYLTSAEKGSKEKVFDGKMAFPKDVKQLVQNLEKILNDRREKSLAPILKYNPKLEYNPLAGELQPCATLGLTPQEAKVALDISNARTLNRLFGSENAKLLTFNPKTLLAPQGLTAQEAQFILDAPNARAFRKFKKMAYPEVKLLEYTPEQQAIKWEQKRSFFDRLKAFFKKL